ncbi:hypothetical protein G9F71_026820 [Clostridium sp. FP2]|uniref:hypothetical protein n=1 Tax=Clostridium sp. FP2 TaxID=2724481 RepID=UPI0013E94BA2|nr:hypothetical protein [Clostridium sp. FP2]MBZ9626420.1 hypothetical protein [Clostridium sp. FP2]
MNNILNKIIDQGNKHTIDLNIINEIEKHIENHIKCDNNLNYELICRFILLEHNVPLCDDEKCISILKYLLEKYIIDNNKYNAYFTILLSWIEDGFSKRSDFTRKKLDNILLNSNDSCIKSMIYYLKALAYNYLLDKDSEDLIELLKLSIKADKNATNSYLLLSNKYKKLDNIFLSKKYLEYGLKSIKKVVSLDDLNKIDMTDIQFFLNSEIKGNIIDQNSYKEIYITNI